MNEWKKATLYVLGSGITFVIGGILGSILSLKVLEILSIFN